MSTVESFSNRAKNAIEELTDVSVAVLFGSHATGRARPDSDVDIAILPAA